MTRVRTLLICLGVLALGALIGLVLSNIWLGLLLGLFAALVIFIAYESRRGRNQGVNDEDHGIEL
ncbi:hypothetical protein GCM10027416_04710 [Okibacterium endophyticum]